MDTDTLSNSKGCARPEENYGVVATARRICDAKDVRILISFDMRN
jgi:hypothetical protein